MKFIQNFLTVYLVFSLFAINGQAQEQIGVASAVNKNTTDLTLEQERKLIDAGYEIIQNHTIETDGIGRAQMLLLDGTAISVGPNSSVVLDKFIYNPETAEGSLEVTARGLLRIVGGKVTKKQPALIRTNSATVGIRGGIGIVQTTGPQTNASFLYGTEMTVTPNCVDLDSFGDQCSPDFATTVTEPGFSVTIESEDSEPSEPVAVTEESLDALQEELGAPEEAPEEESSAEEEISEDEPAAEETQEEEAAPSEETVDEEAPAEETVPESTEAESEAPVEVETETEVASDDAGDSTDIEVDESLLDSSGVSDASSDVEPEDLGTADEYEVALELETVEADDANEDLAGEVAEEVVESTQETTVEVAPIFQVNAVESIESISENLINETLTPLAFINPGELAYTIVISGDDAELVEFDEETLSINLISALDYETQTTLSFTVTIESENADISEIQVLLDVTNIDEPIVLTSTLLADSFAENIDLQSAILESTAIDPEGGDISFTLSGEGSENFSVDANGNISLQAELDYETATSYGLTLTASDGVNETIYEINFSVIDIDEPATLTASTSATSFAEDSLTGINIGIASATDPEGNTITYSLSGIGSENFSVDSAGNISLVNALNYETATSYALTLNASDGVNTTSSDLIITVDDVNEAPSLSNSLVASSFAENTAAGTTIATASASDPESQTITYALSGSGSENFAVDSAGNITLVSSLDYETSTSYSLTLTASDGTNTISNIINIIVDDVTELSIALASSAISLSETAASGTSVTTTTTTIDGNSTVSYSLSGTGSDQFSVDSSGNITTNGTLDYETTTSYSLTLTASDGTNTVTQNFTVSVTDTNLSLSASLASAAQSEGLSTGTTIATSSSSNAEGSVTYSLTDADNKFSINSSTGEVTLANALDYETKTSHEFTITATDGVTTTSETFTLSVSDLKINTLAVTLSNSGAALAESSSSGTSVGSSSITNPESETVSYILSGTGSSNFAVDSSGNVTTNTTLDFETAKSYSLTLTAAAGGNTTTDTFTVNVGNVEELESAVLRYSADYNSVSRSGFSATATRGPSGSGLPSYTLEQVGTTNSTDITSVDDTSNNYVPVEINSGTALNWRYYFPIDTSGNGQFAFAPNSSALDGKYYSPLGTAVTTTIANADFLTAGRLEGAEYWFMTTDKAVVDISYTSQLGSYTSVTDYTPTWDSSDDLLNGVDNSLNGIEIDWIDGNTVNGDDTRHAYGKVTLPSAFTYYDQSIASLWVFSNGYAQIDTGSNTAFRGSDSYFPSTSRGQKGYALDTLFADRIWDEDNKPSNIGLSGEALNYSLFPWWNAQVYSGDNSTGTKLYYVDQTASTGLFIIGWYRSYELSMPDNAAYDSNYEIVLDYNTGNIEFRYGSIPAKNDPSNNLAIGLTGDLSLSSACSFQNSTSANSARSCNGAYEAYLFHDYHFSAQDGDEGYGSVDGNGGITFAPASGTQNAAATSTYNLYEDQVTLAGEVYTDANFVSFTDSTKRVIAMAVIPIENFAASGSSNDYFIPNFIPKTLWSYGDVGHNYCLGAGNDASACNTYENYYDFSSIALDSSDMVDTSRFNGSTNELPEGQSMWWQVLNPSGVGVGLWAQISLKDSYDGASGNTTRDDQQSLLNVVISNVDYRKNDTTRYSAGDTGLGMDGYHYWSYQGATNADNDGLGINYGTSPIECATSNDSGCFWGDSSNQPGGAMITSSDPYKSGSMTLGVNYNSNNDTFSTGSFNVSAVVQDVKPSSSSYADYASLSDFRSSDFYSSSATGYSGFFSGILEFNASGSGNSQLSSIRSSSTLATFTFDTTNDDIQVVAPMTISAAPSNNYTSNWSTVDTGSMTLKFGDATNDETKSTYISSEVFAAEIQDDGAQIDGTSGGSNNLAGVMVSYNTLDKEDTDLFHTGGNDSMPDTAYSTWGFWAMSAVDVSPNSGTQNASVHLGTWVGGEVVDQSEIPTSGSASMSGAAVMNVAYRYNQTGTNYDVHKYTTTADVAATFNWGGSGYSGTLAFTNFDDKNPIVDNAGFASFSVAITGTENTYTGNSTDSLANSWLGGASVAGALYGDSSPDESGGRVNVNLYKSGDTGTAGANDFYFAEGIYLVD
ncbi:cadherin domain-containing protein [Gammaproteobacteria bacterium]|nr:cadherin domain-containing protein [Gammaproteobacteria bacterium]